MKIDVRSEVVSRTSSHALESSSFELHHDKLSLQGVLNAFQLYIHFIACGSEFRQGFLSFSKYFPLNLDVKDPLC